MTTLQDVKPGDRVLVSNRYGVGILTVDKVTATQIVCGDKRYNRKNGWLVGGSCKWGNGEGIEVLTPEKKQLVKDERARQKLSNYLRFSTQQIVDPVEALAEFHQWLKKWGIEK